MRELRVLSTMGVAGVMRVVGPEFEAAQGVRLAAEFRPTQILLQRIREGERGDLAILTDEGVDALVAAGVLVGRTDLARSFVGIAVRAGAPHPDISSPAAFVAALRATPSLAMSQAGASGIFFAGLLERLGMAEEIRAKATVIASGFTAALVVRGEAEMAVQQVSELMEVSGVEVVGRLPPGLEGIATFSAGVFRGAAQPAAAAALIAELASPERADLYRQRGLEPAGSGAAMQA
ncbi:MAG: substrate-binding domain-containing protein [Acetobacteraceae bacterium]